MGVGETITVINRSGKVVKSSKHLVNVFMEAKSAYRERKAVLQAERKAALEEKKVRDGIKTLRLEDDTQSRASSRHSKHSNATHRSKSHRPHKAPLERGYTDSFYANDESPRRSPHRFERDLAGDARQGHEMELTRRHTDMAVPKSNHSRPRADSHVDMDLAYGEIPPPLPVKRYDDAELRDKASKLTMILDEANCLQYSVTSMIDSLQKDPDALAAVALTLAEISSMVSKMGPGVLPLLKGSFPAVVALLLSPQFLIAGGVAVGVTIVALGGYKIIKKLQMQKEEERALEQPYPEELHQLEELESQELSRIEIWRRGIADEEANCASTIVDGEFITPAASKQLVAAGVLDEDDLKSRRSARIRDDKQDKEHREKSRRAKSVKTSRSKPAKESSKNKKKEPSGLRNLFRSHSFQ